jgi:hypothetical protein
MDKKFLNKVLNQIVSETMVDYEWGLRVIQIPFFSRPILSASFFSLSSSDLFPRLFSYHCKNVYSLNEQEIEYVWNEYKHIIKDKINNG